MNPKVQKGFRAHVQIKTTGAQGIESKPNYMVSLDNVADAAPVEGAEAAREALCSAALALALAFFAGPLRC